MKPFEEEWRIAEWNTSMISLKDGTGIAKFGEERFAIGYKPGEPEELEARSAARTRFAAAAPAMAQALLRARDALANEHAGNRDAARNAITEALVAAGVAV